jgi:hypothetical protein
VRTKTAEAYNLGSLEAQEVLGVTFWECFDGPKCGLTTHNDPIRALGRVFDKETAVRYPVSHPQCRRSWGARPDVKTAAHAQLLSTVTAAQTADQEQADRARVAQQYRARRKTAPKPVSRRRAERVADKATLSAAKRGDARVPTRRRRTG